MDHHMMLVRIKLLNIVSDLLYFFQRLIVFFSQVPVEGEMMTEASHELAAIQLSLRPEIATVERGGNTALAGSVMTAANLVVVLGLLQFEVQKHPLPLGVIKDNFPLVELGAVVIELVVPLDEGPDVVAIAPGIVGKEREHIAAFPGEVIDRADHPFAFSSLPGWVT